MTQLTDYFAIYKQAAWDKDIDGLLSLYGDNVLIFDMWSNGFQTGLAEWSHVIKEWFDSLGEEKVKVGFEMINTYESGNVGFASALISYEAIFSDNSVLRSMKNRLTLGFSKEKENWKVIHQHTSAPIDEKLSAILNF